MIRISCPSCHALNQLSLKDDNYMGPFVCWKCKEKMMLSIQHGEVVDCTPLDEDQYNDQLKSHTIKRRY